MPRNVKLLYLVNILSSLRFYTPVLVIYFAQVTGSYAQAMALIALDSLFQAIFEIPTGIFSDLISRKTTIVLSGIAALLCMSFWAIGSNFWFLLLGTFFGGLSGALSSGNDEALLFDSIKEKGKEDQFHKFYSYIGTYTLFAFGLSALIGGFLTGVSFHLVFWISVLFRLAAVVISFFIHSPNNRQENLNKKTQDFKFGEIYRHLRESITLFITNPSLRMLTLSNSISSSLTQSTYQLSPVFVSAIWPLWAVGIFRSSTLFLNAFGNFISGRIIDKFKALNTLISQFIISRILLVAAFIFPTVFSPILMISASLFFGIGIVAQKTLLQNEFTDHQRATMGSLDSLLTRILIGVVSILVGYLADLLGPRNILLLGEILLIPVLFIYWRLSLYHKKYL